LGCFVVVDDDDAAADRFASDIAHSYPTNNFCFPFFYLLLSLLSLSIINIYHNN
jgi:hypothetical protein